MANTTPLQAIANVREDRIHATTTSYPDTVGIKHYNRSYKKVIAKMRLTDNEYFYEQGLSNTVIDQVEYNIIEIVSPNYGTVDINRIKRVFIKYSADQTYYSTAREVSPDKLPYWKDYYAVHQPKTDPIYYIQDNSIWVFPTSTEVVTQGLFVEAIIQPPALLTTDTADKVQVPERINEIIEDGMVSFAMEYIGKPLNECTAQENLFDKRLRDSVNDLALRGDGYVQQSTRPKPII